MFIRWLTATLSVLGLLLLGTAYWVQAAPPGQSAEEGEALFQQYCAGCHTVGGGDLSGPDLLGVAERRDPDWLEHWLAEPDKMIAEGDPRRNPRTRRSRPNRPPWPAARGRARTFSQAPKDSPTAGRPASPATTRQRSARPAAACSART